MKNSLIKIMRECCEDHRIIELYIKSDNETCCLGILLAVSENTYVYASIDTSIKTDGIRMGHIDDISRIVRGGLYIERAYKIIDLLNRNIDYSEYTEHFSNESCDIYSVLKFAQDHGKVVSVVIDNADEYILTGLVTEFDDEIVKIKELDKYGTDMGENIIDIESINFISCNSEDEIFRELLYNDKGDKE